MEDFRASKKFQDEKANFAIAAYKEVVKDAKDKVSAQCAGLDLGFLDEFFALEEDKDGTDAPQDAPTLAATNASEGASASAT